MVESGNDPSKIGSRGEVSEYQIMPRTYAVISNQSLDRFAVNKQISKHVAMSLMANNILQLEDAGLLVNAQNLAMCWNYGTYRTIRACRLITDNCEFVYIPDSVTNYSERVTNLYNDLLLHPQNKTGRNKQTAKHKQTKKKK